MKISYLISPILLIYGLVNVTSDNVNVFGWVATILGVSILIGQLAGYPKSGEKGRGDGGSGGSDTSHTYSRGDSDFSGGDGGGGD